MDNYYIGLIIVLSVIACAIFIIIFNKKLVGFYANMEETRSIRYLKKTIPFLITIILFIVGVNDFIHSRNGDTTDFKSLVSFFNPSKEVNSNLIKYNSTEDSTAKGKFIFIIDITPSVSSLEVDKMTRKTIEDEISFDQNKQPYIELFKDLHINDLLVFYSIKKLFEFCKVRDKELAIYVYNGTDNQSEKIENLLNQKFSGCLESESGNKVTLIELLGDTKEFLVEKRKAIKSLDPSNVNTHLDNIFNAISENLNKSPRLSNIVLFSDLVHELDGNNHSKASVKKSLEDLNSTLTEGISIGFVLFPSKLDLEIDKHISPSEIKDFALKNLNNLQIFEFVPQKSLDDDSFRMFETKIVNLLSLKKVTAETHLYNPDNFDLKTFFSGYYRLLISSTDDFATLNSYEKVDLYTNETLPKSLIFNGFKCVVLKDDFGKNKMEHGGIINIMEFKPTQFISFFYLYLWALIFSLILCVFIIANLHYFQESKKSIITKTKIDYANYRRLVRVSHIFLFCAALCLEGFILCEYWTIVRKHIFLFILLHVFIIVIPVCYYYVKDKAELLVSK